MNIPAFISLSLSQDITTQSRRRTRTVRWESILTKIILRTWQRKSVASRGAPWVSAPAFLTPTLDILREDPASSWKWTGYHPLLPISAKKKQLLSITDGQFYHITVSQQSAFELANKRNNWINSTFWFQIRCSLHVSRFPLLLDHWPEAPWGSLYQLHSKSKHSCSHCVLVVCMCSFSFCFSHTDTLMTITVSIFPFCIYFFPSFCFVSDFFLHAVTDGFRVRWLCKLSG